MKIIDHLFSTLDEGRIVELAIGAFWTAVIAEVNGERRCGLASIGADQLASEAMFLDQGAITSLSGKELAGWANDDLSLKRSLGIAAINALIPRYPERWADGNASEIIARYGKDKNVAIIGHFPFVEALRSEVKELWVLEKKPQPGDLPAERAVDILPCADVIAITAMTLVNQTFDQLLELCPEKAKVLLLGPTAPLSPVVFEHGIDLVSGAVVENIDAALDTLRQGGSFRQIQKMGVRLVTMQG